MLHRSRVFFLEKLLHNWRKTNFRWNSLWFMFTDYAFLHQVCLMLLDICRYCGQMLSLVLTYVYRNLVTQWVCCVLAAVFCWRCRKTVLKVFMTHWSSVLSSLRMLVELAFTSTAYELLAVLLPGSVILPCTALVVALPDYISRES